MKTSYILLNLKIYKILIQKLNRMYNVNTSYILLNLKIYKILIQKTNRMYNVNTSYILLNLKIYKILIQKLILHSKTDTDNPLVKRTFL